MSFINNASPIFVITTIGITMYNNISIGIILFLSHVISSIIIGLIYSRFCIYNIIHENNIKLNTLNKKINKIQYLSSKFDILKQSIQNTYITLSYILGFMIIFNMLSNIVINIIKHFIDNEYFLLFISGLFEMTTSIKQISNLGNLNLNVLLTSFLLGFSGLSIIFQIKASCNIRLKNIIISKLFHGILSIILSYILLRYISIPSINVYSNVQNNYINTNFNLSYFYSIISMIFIILTYIIIQKK
jgi:hypothetical protein